MVLFACNVVVVDVVHIDYEDVDTFAKEFNKLYGIELVGQDMSQLHVDVNMDGAEDGFAFALAPLCSKCVLVDIHRLCPKRVRWWGPHSVGQRAVERQLWPEGNPGQITRLP